MVLTKICYIMRTKHVLITFLALFLLNCSSGDEHEYMTSDEVKSRIEELAQNCRIPLNWNENAQLNKLSTADFTELKRMVAGLSLIPGTYSMSCDSIGDGHYSSTQSLRLNRKKQITRSAENVLYREFAFETKDLSPYPYTVSCTASWHSIFDGYKILSAEITPSLAYLPPYSGGNFHSIIAYHDYFWSQAGKDSINFSGRVDFEIV